MIHLDLLWAPGKLCLFRLEEIHHHPRQTAKEILLQANICLPVGGGVGWSIQLDLWEGWGQHLPAVGCPAFLVSPSEVLSPPAYLEHSGCAQTSPLGPPTGCTVRTHTRRASGVREAQHGRLHGERAVPDPNPIQTGQKRT